MKNLDEYMNNLPVIPDVAMKVISLAEDNVELSFHDLEDIIKIDTSITSKILKVANSALYARQNQVKGLEKAISLLGFNTIKNLVLIISANSAFKPEANEPFYKEYWLNSVLTAFYSKELAILFGETELSDDVFLAGLIHKIGRVALYRQNLEYYKVIKELSNESSTITDFEEHYYSTNHKVLGAQILKSWSFPTLFIDCTKEYGSDNIVSKYKKEVIIISIAELLAREVLTGEECLIKVVNGNQWLEFMGLSLEGLLKEKDSMMERVEHNKDFKDCKTLFN